MSSPNNLPRTCPQSGDVCSFPDFCEARANLINQPGLHEEVIEGVRIADKELEIAVAVNGEPCAEVIESRLARLAVTGVTIRTQRQAEELAERIAFARPGMFSSSL